MSEEEIKEDDKESDLSAYLSTYQWVTVGQLLEGYGLKLVDTSVLIMLREKSSFYFKMLRIPVTNVMAGIIIEQIKAYRIYIQKMFVEYLVSGHADNEADVGRGTRKTLENARVAMLEMGNAFEKTLEDRESLVIETQAKLMKWVETFRLDLTSICKKTQGEMSQKKLTLNDLYDLFSDAIDFEIQESAWTRCADLSSDLKSTLLTQLAGLQPLQTEFNQLIETYEPTAVELQGKLNGLRTQFYAAISEVQDLLMKLPDFELDESMRLEERETIDFDTHIGEAE